MLCGRCAGVETGVTHGELGAFHMYLTDHFSLEELTASEVAARARLSNSPPEMVLEHLKVLAQGLELVRSILGNNPLIIHSGYRSTMVNRLVGGVSNSAHCAGWAADFICPAFGPVLLVCNEVAKKLVNFDQIIFEYGSWCHVSFDPQNRKQVLHITDQLKGYQSGLLVS